MSEIHARLRPLGELLDHHVVGHAEVKQALLLALVCREHIYLEGPPGSAKTLMAELVARGAGLDFFFYQLHRDTRLSELLGDVVLERRPLADGSGERIRQEIEPGGMLRAEVAVLDDVSRAPGEALNVLLRVLNERKLAAQRIPLLTAIATGNPLGDEYYNEPLDPAQLDRFAIQLAVRGLIGSGDSSSARRLVDRFAGPAVWPEDAGAVAPVLGRADLDALHAELGQVEVSTELREALLEILACLASEYGCDESNSLLSDRTFLVKAVKLLRGSAVLAGRRAVESADLGRLSWMTTFRVPPDVHEKVPDLIARIAG